MIYLTAAFTISLLLVFYVYFGYPMVAFFLGTICRKQVKRDETYTPYISIVIAAYNEEDFIEQTVHNKLELDYPYDRLEILVVSDASTDRTNEIVSGIDDPRVRLLIQQERQGKTNALNRAVERATGEILIFSDANSIYDTLAVRYLMANFADDDVGYVTGSMVYMGGGGTIVGDGCSSYMRYENYLRKYETLMGSVVGVNGGIDAVRRTLYTKMGQDQIPDFVLPLYVISRGYRVVYDDRAILRENVLKIEVDEARMRYRVALRTLWAIYDNKGLLLYFNNLTYSFQLWSHKVLRYFVPELLIIALITNFLLSVNSRLFAVLFFLQIIFYLLAANPEKGIKIPLINRLVKPANYFLLVNVSFFRAVNSFILGKKIVVWNPRKD